MSEKGSKLSYRQNAGAQLNNCLEHSELRFDNVRIMMNCKQFGIKQADIMPGMIRN